MRKVISFLVLMQFVCVGLTQAQAVFKKYGFNKAPITLSQGKYNEFFTNEVVVQIGTVKLNTRTNQVIEFLEEDTTKANYKSEFSSRWLSVDPLAEKYPNYSPYVYCANNPVNVIDPDGRRLYFVGGANNDKDGWNYINRWGKAFNSSGISGFTRVNASRGKWGDVAFTTKYRNSGTETYFKGNVSPNIVGGLSPSSELATRPVQNEVINSTVSQIQLNFKTNPLKEGEQLNLGGYSYGSVLQAQVALKLADSGTKVDNLILIGCPISTDSELYKQLSENKNIGNIIRFDIPNDKLSNPSSILEYMEGAIQNIGDDGPHFSLARPGADVNKAIKAVTDWIKTQDVK